MVWGKSLSTIELELYDRSIEYASSQFSSDKKYPAYWAMSSNVSYLNVYSQVRGNPYLEPERIYMARANYILKKKYVLDYSPIIM